MGFSDYEKAGVLLCELICNSLGLLGVVLVMILYFGYSSVRIYTFKLVFFFALCTAGYSIGVLIGPSDNYVCQIQGVFVSYFGLASIIWLGLITHSAHSLVIHGHNPESNLKKYLLIGFLGPLPSTIIPAIINFYKRNPLGMCWVSSSTPGGKALIILQLLLVLISTMIYIAYVLISLQKALKKRHEDVSEATLASIKYFNRLKHFSIIIYLSWTFALINLLALLSDDSSPSFALTILHVMLTGLQGVFCIGAFIKDHVVYEALIDTFSTCLPCLIKRSKKKRKLELTGRV